MENISFRQDECHVTTKEATKEPITGLGKKKQPCSNSHYNVAESLPATEVTSNGNTAVKLQIDQNKTCMLVDNALYFTIQTSPPDEPEELFHKELPIRNTNKAIFTDANCDNNLNCKADHLVRSNDNCICDIGGKPCEVSSLTKSLSWLKLNSKNAKSLVQLHDEGNDDDDRYCNSSLEISNPNSAVLSDNHSFSLASPNYGTSKTAVKRKFSPLDAEDVLQMNDVTEKMKSKRRCVVFNEQSFTLNTPPCSDKSHASSGIASVDMDKPSTLKRQKVIRRKNGSRKRDFVTVPQTIYNKNLKSWLTLPNGIPSPFEVNDEQFKILSCTPMTTHNMSPSICEDTLEFSLMKKAVSTPKPNFVLELTEDIFLSPGIRPLLDSVIMNTSLENNDADSKTKSDTNYVSPVSEQQTWNSHHILPDAVSSVNDINCSTSSTQSTNSSKINDDQDVFSSIGE